MQLALDRHAGLVGVDGELVTVQAGMRLHGLEDVLAAHGLALPDQGDIDRPTVPGAISTGTQGTGERLGGLATFVEALTLVDGPGGIVRAAAGTELLAAAAVSLGALGVISVALRCVPAFVLRADEGPAAAQRRFAKGGALCRPRRPVALGEAARPRCRGTGLLLPAAA